MFVLGRLRLIIACVASGVVAAACAAQAPSSSANTDLVGTRWIAALIDGAPVRAGHAPVLVFGTGDRLTGSGGCNALTAFYEADNGNIDVRGLGRTEMACDTSVMVQEDAFFDLITEATRYAREGDRLVITAANGRNLVLTPAG